MGWTTTASSAAGQGIKILVHGPAGAGKTRLCATTGDPAGTLIVSAEAGLLSLRGEHDMTVYTVESLSDVEEVLAYLESPDNAFRWVCVDSISEIAEVCLSALKASTKDPRAAYGDMADRMFRTIRRFRNLPCNVYMSAKQEKTPDADGRLLRQPSLPGRQLTQGISYLFDEVFALRVDSGEDGSPVRWLQCHGDGTYEAKDRSGALDLSEWADLAAIARKIHPAA
jgi:hypothetical protein